VELDRNFLAPAGPEALALAVVHNQMQPPTREQLAKEHPDQTQTPSPADLRISLTRPEAHVATTISDARERNGIASQTCFRAISALPHQPPLWWKADIEGTRHGDLRTAVDG
jgi:hypothetical protein